MSASGEYRHFTGLSFQRRRFNSGISVSPDSVAASRRMAVVAEIANVIDGPTLAFRIISTSSFQLWVPCFRSTRSGILRASRFDGEALATTALSAGCCCWRTD